MKRLRVPATGNKAVSGALPLGTRRFRTPARKEQCGFGRLPAPALPLFAGPRRRRSGGERRSRPVGRRAGCPESREVTQRNGLVRSAGTTSTTCRGRWNCSRLCDRRCGHAATYLGTEVRGKVSRRVAPLWLCSGLAVTSLWLLRLPLRAGSALLFRGPLGGGEAGTKRPRSGRVQGWIRLFARARCPLEKPGPASRTRRAGCPQSANRGVVSSW